MGQADVLRLLRTLSKHPDLASDYQKDDASRRKIIAENGGISAEEEKMLLRRDKAEIQKYLNDNAESAQQIQVY